MTGGLRRKKAALSCENPLWTPSYGGYFRAGDTREGSRKKALRQPKPDPVYSNRFVYSETASQLTQKAFFGLSTQTCTVAKMALFFHTGLGLTGLQVECRVICVDLYAPPVRSKNSERKLL